MYANQPAFLDSQCMKQLSAELSPELESSSQGLSLVKMYCPAPQPGGLNAIWIPESISGGANPLGTRTLPSVSEYHTPALFPLPQQLLHGRLQQFIRPSANRCTPTRHARAPWRENYRVLPDRLRQRSLVDYSVLMIG